MCGIGDATLSLFKASKAEWAKRCSYTGIFIIFSTVSISAFWGNLSVYTESYFKERLGPHINVSAAWLLTFCTIGASVGGIFAGHIAGLIGRKWTVIVGCIILDFGLFLSVLIVPYSSIGLDLSLGLLGGLAQGLTLNTGLEHVMSFQPKYMGLVTAVITAGRYFGGASWNQMITWYINPANLTPDLFDGLQKYFTQAEVLDRVPSLFFVMGVIFLCFHVLGVSLIRPNDKDLENQRDFHEEEIDGAERGEGKAQEVRNGHTSSKNSTEPPEKDETFETKNVSPRQMLTKKTFYLLCYILVSAQYTDIVFIIFFKPYGLMWIPDDQFLATLSTVILLVTIAMQPVLGGLLDICGLTYSTVLLSFILCLFSNFWYFTPMLSPWLYFVWTTMYGSTVSGFFLYMPVMTLKLFGPEYFSTNYGIVMCSRVLASFLAPSVIQTLLNDYGYFYLFLSGGLMNALGVILTIVCLPRD